MSDFIDIATLEKLKEEIVSGIKTHEEQSNSRGRSIPRVWRSSSPEYNMREVHKKQLRIIKVGFE